MLSLLIVICTTSLAISAHPVKIHKHMTRDEVRKTFQTDEVPYYEIVPVFHTLHKRDVTGNSTVSVKVDAFERQISLYLEPNEGLLADFSTPVWTASAGSKSPQNVEYTLVPNAFAKIGRPYQDPIMKSSILAYEGTDGETLITGNLLSDLIIQPIPHRLNHVVTRATMSLKTSIRNISNFNSNFRRTHHHIVFRRDLGTNETFKIVKRDLSNHKFANRRSKRSIPDIIYPEILAIIDYSLFGVLNENVEEATRYALALWNGVDLRYRLLTEPKIRLNIAGIIISVTSGGTPYIQNYRRGSTELDADLALTSMSHYFYRESSRFHFDSYDMAVALTQLDMCNMGFYGICDTSTLGYAYEWGACNRSSIDENTEAVGIVEDNGGYKGIIATAHEVAHLLGVSHDESVDDCSGYDGFIMSSVFNPGNNSFSWSQCSLQYFYEFISSEEATCLLNKPRSGAAALRRLLPGRLASLDDQCEKFYGTRACYHDERVCTRLECYIPGLGGFCTAKSPAAEGSYCGDGLHCINGHCISINETLVPYVTNVNIYDDDFLNDQNFFLSPRWNTTWNGNTDPQNEYGLF